MKCRTLLIVIAASSLEGCLSAAAAGITSSIQCDATESSAEFITQMLLDRSNPGEADEKLGGLDEWAHTQGLGGAAYLAARFGAVSPSADQDWRFAVKLVEAFIPVYRANDAGLYQTFFATWTRRTKQRCPGWRGSFLPFPSAIH
ncbi:hypothetical protein ACFQRC_03070 [Enterovirga sp. GCM10030262]|uniref:hypothetical protein n=1 Tax=Enterovirga sp. GCM10030262 TaxID=3273391 RepID=UPI003620E312